MRFDRALWITWENQRRSLELARRLGARLVVFAGPRYDDLPRLRRYAVLSLKTLGALWRERPPLVFAQNPSIMLAALLCAVKKILGFKLVVDRHSNFKFGLRGGLNWSLFQRLSRYTLRKADLTIVTNKFLKDVVERAHGRGFVLQDPLPELSLGTVEPLQGERNVVYVSSFSNDEPVEQVLGAAELLPGEWRLHITGNPRRFLDRHPGLHVAPNV
jgi:glycosyltransferase involved in cell wall biosynthesis